MSMAPISEARGAIIYGLGLGMNPGAVLISAILLNILAIPIICLYVGDEIFFISDLIPFEGRQACIICRKTTVRKRIEKVEEKGDYKNLDWLRHQWHDLGKSIQDIADEQGVSMITIRKWLDKCEKR